MINNTKIYKHRFALIVWALPVLALLIFHYYFSSVTTIEDSQQILFPIVVLILFFLTLKRFIALPIGLFFISLIVWILLLFRIDIMDRSQFFTGRVVVGRFADDPYGLESRKLFKSLQKIALTYHLPGPSLLPVLGANKTLLNSKNIAPKVSELRHPKIQKSVPALEIYGTSKQYNLVLSQVTHPGVKRCTELPEQSLCKEVIDFDRISLVDSPISTKHKFVLPSYPSSIQVRTKPGYTVEHYIEWLSAYLSPEISTKPEIRFDVLFEAATLDGLEVQSLERIFVKILLSYEELAYYFVDGSPYHLNSSRERLSELLYLVKTIKSPELHGFAYNLYALSLIYSSYGSQEIENAKKTLIYIAESKDISLFQRKVAAYNLGTLEHLLMF